MLTDAPACLSRRQLAAAVAAAAARAAALPRQAAAAAAPLKPFCSVVDRPPAWAFGTPWQEDLMEFGAYKIWYRDVNNPDLNGVLKGLQQRYVPTEAAGKLPLLVVAGGPGLPHDYLDSLELAAAFRRVIFYDSVGTGFSYAASGRTVPLPADISPALLMDELDALSARLGLPASGFHVYGQGTGGMLALQWAAERAPAGLKSLTLASVADSYAALVADRRRAAEALGGGAAELLLSREGDDAVLKDWRAAYAQYQQRYVCRRAEAAGCLGAARRGRSRAAFEALAGGRVFSAAGQLAGWQAGPLAGRLGSLPVLVCRGADDEVSAESAGRLAAAFTGGQVQTVPGYDGCGSYMHIDSWQPHLEGVEAHLSEAEGSKVVALG